MAAPAFRYHAFISHCPADNRAPGRRWADWLRHELESFEIPADVAGRRTPVGPVPSRLFPVFVSGGGEMTREIEEAIEQSRVMVVVCSPGAAQSARIGAEVAHFKRSGRDRVLALIVSGEPDPRLPEDECFPDALKFDVAKDGTLDREWRLRAPAVDVRCDGGREGFTSAAAYGAVLESAGNFTPDEIRIRVADYTARLNAGRLRIIAGVLGVPPAELAKRDHAAQLRVLRRGRRRAHFVAALFAMVATAAGYFAWRENERRQALVDARTRSDALIASLQNGLREKLEPIGQHPLLADVNERITSHLTLATRDDENPKLLAALAASLGDAVEIHSARSEFSEALNAARLSLSVTERLGRAAGADTENSLRRIAMLRRMAGILVRMNQPSAALAQADAARNLGAALVRDEPGFRAAALETAWAHYDAGDILAGLGKPGEARSAIAAGRELAARLVANVSDDAGFLRALAEGHARLGELFQQSAAFPEAMGEFREAERIIAALAATAQASVRVQASLVFVRERMGIALALQRDFAGAAEQQRQVVEITERLTRSESSNRTWHFAHAEALRRLGETLLQADAANRTETLTLYQRALDRLAAHFEGDADPRVSRLRAEIEGLMKAASR
jgi:tetratricopeptide (TPR) repeat protein